MKYNDFNSDFHFWMWTKSANAAEPTFILLFATLEWECASSVWHPEEDCALFPAQHCWPHRDISIWLPIPSVVKNLTTSTCSKCFFLTYCFFLTNGKFCGGCFKILRIWNDLTVWCVENPMTKSACGAWTMREMLKKKTTHVNRWRVSVRNMNQKPWKKTTACFECLLLSVIQTFGSLKLRMGII